MVLIKSVPFGVNYWFDLSLSSTPAIVTDLNIPAFKKSEVIAIFNNQQMDFRQLLERNCWLRRSEEELDKSTLHIITDFKSQRCSKW
jgi:hypothetical protein